MMTDFHYFLLPFLLSPLVTVLYSWVGNRWKIRRQKKLREQIEALHNRISDGEIFIKNDKIVIIALLYRIIDIVFEACFLVFLLCMRIALMIEPPNPSFRIKISGFIIQALAMGILLRIAWK